MRSTFDRKYIKTLLATLSYEPYGSKNNITLNLVINTLANFMILAAVLINSTLTKRLDDVIDGIFHEIIERREGKVLLN